MKLKTPSRSKRRIGRNADGDLDEDIFAKRKYLWTALDRTSRIKDRILHVNVAGVQEENS